MKKFRLKLYLVFLTIFLLTFLIFYFGYLFLANNFIEKQAGINLSYGAEKVAVEYNLVTEREYTKFTNLVGDEVDPLIIIEKLEEEKDIFNLGATTTINFGYLTYNKNEVYYNLPNNNTFETFMIKNEVYSDFHKDIIAIYKLSYVLFDYQDQTNFIFFKYRNIIMYFQASTFLSSIFKDIDGLPNYTFQIMQKDGIITFEETSNSTNKKFFGDYVEGQRYTFNQVSEDLKQGRAGFGIFEINNEREYLVYAPISGKILNEPMFICFRINYQDGVSILNYVRNVTLVIFAFIFLVLNATFVISGVLYNRKESDLSISRINQYYLKPFVLKIKRKGKIISMNKSFRNYIDDLSRYETVDDINLFDETIDILELIKKQTGFTSIFKNINKQTIYIHFLSIKSGSKYILLGENVTETVEENIKNRQIALYNPVTNLPNKNLLDAELKHLIVTGMLTSSNNSLIAVDIVDFNKINRIFGFTSADKMLRQVTKLLTASVEGFEATVFNIRTSLFMVLIKKVANFNDVIIWSKKLIQTFQEPITIKDDYLTTVDFKMGIFNIEPKKVEDFDVFKIYDCAALALDRASSSRMTKCAIYSAEFGQMLSRDQIMEEDLRQAIHNNEFVMYYQPQYNLKTKKISGFEALVRWDNPKYKLESVEHFISLAEKNGMIIEIGHLIMDSTFRFAKSIENTGIHVSINVSPVQLLQSGFVTDLVNCFEKYKLRRESIAVEITETFLMENSDSIISKLNLLRDKGFSIHLDDFGIGYSSMLYLKDLPVNVIKIDKEFIKHILNDKFSRIIVSKVIQIALNLNLDIICEGVETEKQSELLYKMGCTLIQGYLISKPIPEDDALKFIDKFSFPESKVKKVKTKDIEDPSISE